MTVELLVILSIHYIIRNIPESAVFGRGGGLWFAPCHTAQKKGENSGVKRINFF